MVSDCSAVNYINVNLFLISHSSTTYYSHYAASVLLPSCFSPCLPLDTVLLGDASTLAFHLSHQGQRQSISYLVIATFQLVKPSLFMIIDTVGHYSLRAELWNLFCGKGWITHLISKKWLKDKMLSSFHIVSPLNAIEWFIPGLSEWWPAGHICPMRG